MTLNKRSQNDVDNPFNQCQTSDVRVPQRDVPNSSKSAEIDAFFTKNKSDLAARSIVPVSSTLLNRNKSQDVQEVSRAESSSKVASVSVPPLVRSVRPTQDQTRVVSNRNDAGSFESNNDNPLRDVSDEVRQALLKSRRRLADNLDAETSLSNSSLNVSAIGGKNPISTAQSIKSVVPTIPSISPSNSISLAGLSPVSRQRTKSLEEYFSTTSFSVASTEPTLSFGVLSPLPVAQDESPEYFLERLPKTRIVAEPSAATSEELDFLQSKSVLEKASDDAPMWLASLFAHALLVFILAFIVIKVENKSRIEIISEPGFSEQTVLDEVFDPEPTFDQNQETEIDASDLDVQSEIVADVPDVSAFHDESASTLALAESSIGFEPVPSAEITNLLGSVNGDELDGRGEAKSIALATGGGNEGSEKAVALALAWLAEHQLPNGAWTFQLDKVPTCGGRCANAGANASINAATAMGLLPFLAAGHTPTTGKYKRVVAKGLNYLTQAGTESENGLGYNDAGNMYAHGLATIALCETYAMLKPREKSRYRQLGYLAQEALNFIEYAQADDGGWRYTPKQAGDTSVVGWQIMALKSGQLGGLCISDVTVRNARDFLQNVVGFEDGSRYYYANNAGSSNATDSIGLLCRLYLDWRVDNPQIQKGAARLSEIGPQLGNPYYNYYAAQLFHHLGGETWRKWNDKTRDALINSQCMEGHERGSWFPSNPDGHCTTGGRLYATSLNCMILEVYYRHMPLYQRQANETKFPLEAPQPQ